MKLIGEVGKPLFQGAEKESSFPVLFMKPREHFRKIIPLKGLSLVEWIQCSLNVMK